MYRGTEYVATLLVQMFLQWLVLSTFSTKEGKDAIGYKSWNAAEQFMVPNIMTAQKQPHRRGPPAGGGVARKSPARS